MVDCLTKLYSLELKDLKTEQWFEKYGRFFGCRTRRLLRLEGPYLSCHTAPDSPALWVTNLRANPYRLETEEGTGRKILIIPLANGDERFVPDDSQVFFDQVVPKLCTAVDSNTQDFYELDRVLGEGAFARVYLARGRATGTEYAVKVVQKVPEELQFIAVESRIASTIFHPGIVRTYDIFEQQNELDIVMELMRGGELFDQIADRGRFSEKDASMVMRSIVQAISFLHLHHIVHRDLKPENVLCKDSSWPLVVKLSDFGLASATEDKINDGELIGTPGYVAPEVVMRKPYDFAVDMWAAGVILYIMLSGKMPFFGKTDRECLRKIATGRYAFPPRQWSTVSEDAQSLIRSLLQVDPAKRLTAVAALNHKWLCDPHTCCSEPLTNDLRELHSTKRKFRKAVNAVITLKKLSQLSQEE
ncbi:hypothetical protein NDN08_000177 [Rhodosorus marinus]|uniref:Protein kinase domain-containing protein n=1 Tax=Rhodosorus marinus TaxID=101924 RepID=A0AAV8UII1_9RHOD|nr:hypothetical protein NDN08_000177 [Rhodosorus marinus]